MDEKIEKTVQETVVALARIQRFVAKYHSSLSKDQIERISSKIAELQNEVQSIR